MANNTNHDQSGGAPLDYWAEPRAHRLLPSWVLKFALAMIVISALIGGCAWLWNAVLIPGELVWSGRYRQEGSLVVYCFICETKGGRLVDCSVSVCTDAPSLENCRLFTDRQGADSHGSWYAMETEDGKRVLKTWSHRKARCAWGADAPIELSSLTQPEIDMLRGSAWYDMPLAALAAKLYPSLPATTPSSAPSASSANSGNRSNNPLPTSQPKQ